MARSILSRGIDWARALVTASRRRAFIEGSGTPSLAATVISRASLENTLLRAASLLPLRNMIFLACEWPAIGRLPLGRSLSWWRYIKSPAGLVKHRAGRRLARGGEYSRLLWRAQDDQGFGALQAFDLLQHAAQELLQRLGVLDPDLEQVVPGAGDMVTLEHLLGGGNALQEVDFDRCLAPAHEHEGQEVEAHRCRIHMRAR